MAAPHLMRHYSVSLEIRDGMLNVQKTLFSRNPLDADQLIGLARQHCIECSLESNMLLLSNPATPRDDLLSMKIHNVGSRHPASLKEFRRLAKLIGAVTLGESQ